MSDLSWPMYPPPESENFFLSEVRFELANVPPPPGLKINLEKMKCSFLDYLQLLMISQMI